MKIVLKKIVSIVICFAMLMALLPKLNFTAKAEEIYKPSSIGKDDISYDETTKTYSVKTANGLYWIDLAQNEKIDDDTYPDDPSVDDFCHSDQYRFIVLCKDIDMKGIDWEPIKKLGYELNGAGHKISNINIITIENKACFVDSCETIRNLTISGTSNVSKDNVCAGFVDDALEIINCVSEININVQNKKNCYISGICNFSEKIENSIYNGK